MRRISKLLLFFLSIIFYQNFLYSQNKIIDSLLAELKTAKGDTNRVNTLNRLGYQLGINGGIDKAIQYSNDALLLADKLSFKKGIANAYHELGRLYSFQTKYSEALNNYYMKALKIREDIGDIKGIASTSGNIGNMYQVQGNYAEALKYYSKSLKLAREVGDKVTASNACNNIGANYYYEGNYAEAIKYYSEALRICEETGNLQCQAIAYLQSGVVYTIQGNFAESLKNQKKALKIFEELRNKYGAAMAYTNIGIIYQNQGIYTEASKNFYSALKLAEEMGNKVALNTAYSNLGNIYLKQKNYTDALKNMEAALKLAEEAGNKQGVALSFYNIGSAYMEQVQILIDKNADPNIINEKLSMALRNFQEGLKISEEIGSKTEIKFCNSGVGSNYLVQAELLASQKGEHDLIKAKLTDALKYQLKALEISEALGDKEGISFACSEIGKIYLQQAKVNKRPPSKETFQYLNKSLLLSKETGLKEEMKRVYAVLEDAYKEINDYKKALEYANLYHAIKDSLLGKETTQELNQLRTQYEVDKAITEEKAQQEKTLADLNFKYLRKEDSIKYQKQIAEEKLSQQLLLSKQQEQELLLKQSSLDLIGKQNELNKLGFLNTQIELEAEQLRRQEKEQQLTLAEKEKEIQEKNAAQANVLHEKDKAEQKRKTEMLMLGSGMLLLVLLFAFLYLRQRSLKQRAVERADAIHKMSELELQSLRAQLNPHFMFNSLNAIQSLILKQDNRNSHRYLSQFSKLLRMMLDGATQPIIPLKKELEFLELYLSLEKLRIPDLQYTIETDPQIDIANTMLPNMMLQPYVENALWHGLSPKQGEKKMGLRIQSRNGSIHYEIEDNGIGRKKAAELKTLNRNEHHSLGMELLSKRFNLLSKEYGFVIDAKVTDLADNGTATGTLVEINLPSDLAEQINKQKTKVFS